MSRMPMPSERRWIILAQDGRHVTMGRAAPPSEADVEAAAAVLTAQGLSGWLATLDGNYWSRRRVALAPVQMLGDGPLAVPPGAARRPAIVAGKPPIWLDLSRLFWRCSGAR